MLSDRIAVLSVGGVEEFGFADDFYVGAAPRFVAGFIGTSNIVEAEVTGRVGELLQIASAPGDRLLVAAPTDRSISIGQQLAFTVRPEKLRVEGENEPVADQLCTVAGTVVDVVYQGVSTQLVIRTDAGTTLVAFRQNSERVSDAGVPGSRARLVWSPEFNVVLGDEPVLEKEMSA
ncbi:MAG: spermidine/putrescine transport system ATP-binding protein [Actinomycetota bacterium]|nr:spermidine/putrescine transport system ATP-binding protein [Actinomycetota bacterium]